MVLQIQSKPKLWGDSYLPRYRTENEREEEAQRNGKKVWGEAYKHKFLPQGDDNERQFEARNQLPSQEDEERRNSLQAQMALLKVRLKEKLKEARAQQHRKLEELLQPLREEEDYDSGNFVISFELAGLIQQNRFEGVKSEDPRGHVISFLKLCDQYDLTGLSKDRVRRMLFPRSLAGCARSWHEEVCGNEEQTFVTTCEKFINKFCDDQEGPKLGSPTEGTSCEFLSFQENEQITHPPSDLQEALQAENPSVKDEVQGIFLETELMQKMESAKLIEEYCSNDHDVFSIEVSASQKFSDKQYLVQVSGGESSKKAEIEAENEKNPAMQQVLRVLGNLEELVKHLLEKNQVLERTVQQQALELKMISENQKLNMEAWRSFKAAGKQKVDCTDLTELEGNSCSKEPLKPGRSQKETPKTKQNNKKKKAKQNPGATRANEFKEAENISNPIDNKKVNDTPEKMKEIKEVIISRALNEIRKGMRKEFQQPRHPEIKGKEETRQRQIISLPHVLIDMLMKGEREEIKFRGRKFKLKKDPVVPPDLT